MGGKENVAGQKTGSKIHQGKRTTLRAVVWASGRLGATQAAGQALRGQRLCPPLEPLHALSRKPWDRRKI